jgi:hypothetical protein
MNPALIADMAPSPTAGDWAYNAKFFIELAIASFVAFAYFNGRDKAKKMSVEPQPLVVKPAEDFVTRAEFNVHVDSQDRRHFANEEVHKDLFSVIGGKERGLRESLETNIAAVRLELSNDMKRLAENMVRISNDVAALSAHVERQRDQIQTAEGDIKGILKTH